MWFRIKHFLLWLSLLVAFPLMIDDAVLAARLAWMGAPVGSVVWSALGALFCLPVAILAMRALGDVAAIWARDIHARVMVVDAADVVEVDGKEAT